LTSKILVVPGPTQAAHTLLISPVASLTAGQSYTFDIRAKDIFDNTVLGGEDRIDFKLFGPTGSEPTETVASMEYLFALHRATFTLLKRGAYSGIVTVTQRQGLLATYYETIGFSAPVLRESLHSFTASTGSDPYAVSATTGDSTHFTRLDRTIDFDLVRNSFLADLVPALASPYPTVHFSVWWRGYLRAPASSLYRIHIESYEAAFFELQVSGEVLIESAFKNENELSALGSAAVVAVLSADVWLEEGNLVPINLRYAKKLGPTRLRLLWESDSLERTVIPADCLFHELGSETTPFALSVSPASTDASTSSLTNDLDYRYAVVDVEETLVLNARDAHGNQQSHQTDVVRATLVEAAPQDPAAPATVSATVSATADGVYEIRYTLATASPHYSLAVEVQAEGSGPFVAIAGSPFTVVCQVAVTDPANTVISGPGAVDAIAGHLTEFQVTLFDAGNNQRTSGGDQLAVTIVASPSGSPVVTAIEVFDGGDGTYRVGYVATDSSSAYTISVTVNADGTNSKTSTLTVASNNTSPAASGRTWADGAAADREVDLEQAYTFTTALKDAFGNPIKERTWTLVTEIEGQGQRHYSTAALTDLAGGEYSSSFTLPSSTDPGLSLCGVYSLHQYLTESGGLSAAYYPNQWFSPRGTPYLRRLDPLINFNWAEDADIIPGIAREYVSVEWTGYLKPALTGAHTFFVEADDGVRLSVDGTVLIDSMTEAVGGTQRLTSEAAVALVAGELVPIEVQYFQATGPALIALYWSDPGSAGEFTVVPSANLYYKANETAVGAATTLLTARHTPQAATGLKQADSSTYEAAALTLEWLAPADTGCLAVLDYSVEATLAADDASWHEVADGIAALTGRAADDGAGGGAAPYFLPGRAVSLRLRARNLLGLGEPSARITLYPAALPSAPAEVRTTYGADGTLTLDWDIPLLTGGGDQSAVAPATLVYRLEVDEGFQDASGAADPWVALTSKDPDGLDPHSPTSFTHGNLLVGHAYKYRVKAANLMGYGPYSGEYSFVPRVVPAAPPLAPRNRPELTTRATLYLAFDAVLVDGGAPITEYLVYLDDGLDSDSFVAYAAGTTLLFDTSAAGAGGAALSLVADRTYRAKYSAVNVAGEGPLSPEVSVRLAEKPGAPGALRRINTPSLPAGQVAVKWDAPADDGGSAVTGYTIYLDGLPYYNSTEGDSTLSEHTLTTLTVGREYTIAVSARNRIGEGVAASLTALAASPPPKMAPVDFHSATSASIKVNATLPTYTGGSPLTAYAFRRDDGPLTDYEAQELQAGSLGAPLHDFTGLDSAKRVYKVQIAAVNVLGQGEWSDSVSLHATAPPPDCPAFQVVSQGTAAITVQWSAPALSGDDCAIEGYRVLLEDILEPGYRVAYDGVRSTSTTTATLSYPTIRPSRYYKLLLQAKNCGEVLSPGQALTVASASVPTAMATPTLASYDSATSMTVAWEDPAYSGGFSVLEFRLYVDNGLHTAGIDPSKNTLQLTGLTLGTEYKLRVSAVNEVGESSLSPSARVPFANRPSAPASLALTSTAAPSVQAVWTAPAQVNGDAVSGYRLYMDNAAGGEEAIVYDGSQGQAATYGYGVSGGLRCGATYTLRVTAFNVAGESDARVQTVEVGEAPSPPLFPRWTAIVALGSVTVAWDDPLSDGCLPVLHYVVSRDGVDRPAAAAPGANSYTDDISAAADFPLGTAITYQVRAVNSAGASEPSVALVVTVGQVPGAPGALAVSRRDSETAVELAWTADAPVAGNAPTLGFRVYVDDGSGNAVVPIEASTPLLEVAGLVLGHSYSVSVTAVNSIGESAHSSPALALHTGLVPSRLLDLTAPRLVASTATSITIAWLPPAYNGGAPLAGYRVYWDVGSSGTWASAPVTDLAAPTYTLDSGSPGAGAAWTLTSGDLVDFYVTSLNIIGEAEPSDVISLYAAPVPSPPSAPTKVRVFTLPGSAEYGAELGVEVAWAAPAGGLAPLLGYKLYLAEEQSPLRPIYDGSQSRRPDVTSFTLLEGVTKSLYYKFRVQAYNEVGASELSDELVVHAAIVPSAPVGLEVTGSGEGTISLAWSAPREPGGSVLTGYSLYHLAVQAPAETTANEAWLGPTAVPAAASEYTLGGLTAAAHYRVRIAAANAEGEGAPSSSVSQYAGAVPSGLGTLEAVPGSRTADSLALRWAAPASSSTTVLGFRVYANEPDSGAVPSRLVYDGQSVPGLVEVRVHGLESGRAYWFSHQARSLAGWSAPSTPYLRLYAGPLPSPPAEAPKILSVSAAEIAFSWTASPAGPAATLLTGYRVYDAASTLLAEVSAETLSHTLAVDTPGRSYLISVSAVSEIGESELQSLATRMLAVELPPAPDVAITGSSRDSCHVSWSAVTAPAGTSITGYVILVDDGRNGDFRVAHDGATNPAVFEAAIYGLRSETNYRITGYALNEAGPGASAAVMSCFTASAPGVPGRPTLVASAASSIEVAWEPAYDNGGSPIKEYRLWADLVEGLGAANVVEWGSSPVYTGTALRATIGGLVAGKAYRFRVQAVSEHLRTSPYSSVAVFYAAAPPAQITFDTAAGAHLEAAESWIHLAWVRPTIAADELLVDAYILYWDEGSRSSGNLTQLARIDAYDQNFYNVTGRLATGHRYAFQVAGVNKVGEGPLSAEVSATAASLPGRLGAPERVAASAESASSASVTVRWFPQQLVATGGVPLTGFRLYYFLVPAATPDLVLGPDGGALLAYDGAGHPEVTAQQVTGLDLDADYAFFVTALNPAMGPAGDLLRVRAAGFPDAPAAITELAGSRTGTSIGLEWPAPAEAGGSAVLSYTLAIVVENEEDRIVYHGSARSATVGGLEAGEEYEFKVRATTLVGDSEWSPQTSSFLIVDAPSAPLQLEVLASDATHVSLRWQQPSSSGGQPLTGFQIHREDCSDVSAPAAVLIATLPASTFTYTDSTVTAGLEYKYFAAAYNALGGVGPSSAGAPAKPISPPTATAAPALVARGKDFIAVEWASPGSAGGSPISKYLLYARAEYEATYSQVYAGIALAFRLSAAQYPALLRPGYEYYFKVRSVNEAGQSPLSDPSAPILAAEAPTAPQNVSLVSRSASRLELAWTRPADAGGAELLGYRVYVAEGSAAYAEVASAPSRTDPTVLRYVHEGAGVLTEGATYKFRVTAHNEVGEGEAAQLRTQQPLVGDAVDYVLAADLPGAPLNPPTVATYTESAIGLTLGPVEAARSGGAAVTGYLVEIDDGLGGPAAGYRRVHDSLSTSLIISNLVGGRTYHIRYAARNVVYDSGNLFGCDALRWSPLQAQLTAVAPQAPTNLR
jgi:hypothetical protein